MNYNIPHFKCQVPISYFVKQETEGYYDCIAFGVQSLPGKILTFHIVTDHGIMRSRVPLSKIFIDPKGDVPEHFKQLWDCFSINAHIVEYDFLGEHRCQVMLRDKSKVWATYMFTIDWHSNPYSDEPTDYKCGHVLLADDGYLLCQPNNRILWKDSNFIVNELPDLKSHKVDVELNSVENISEKWVSENTNCYFYDVNSKDEV